MRDDELIDLNSFDDDFDEVDDLTEMDEFDEEYTDDEQFIFEDDEDGH